jgi:hypothetical protein
MLVATAIAGVVLAGGWAWCWSVSSSCAVGAERIDAASSLAFARRLSANELRGSEGLVATSGAGCTTTAISFIVPAASGTAPELITYVWDAARRVVWRKAPGSHVAEGVDSFSISYFDDQVRLVLPASGGALSTSELSRVRLVELSAVISCGRQTASASWWVCLRDSP